MKKIPKNRLDTILVEVEIYETSRLIFGEETEARIRTTRFWLSPDNKAWVNGSTERFQVDSNNEFIYKGDRARIIRQVNLKDLNSFDSYRDWDNR